MNRFEREGTEQAEVARTWGVVSAWKKFCLGFELCVDSYNKTPDGEIHPAKLSEESDKTMLVECPRGKHPHDLLRLLIVTVRATLQGDKFRIDCAIEKWSKSKLPTNMPAVRESLTKKSFALHSDNETLMLGDQMLSPSEAAEDLLGEALLK